MMITDSANPQNPRAASSTDQLLQLIYGTIITQMIAVAAQLRIADFLDGEPKSVKDLAAATDTHAPTLYRLLRALANVGIFAEIEPQRFTLTPLARLLQSDAPNSLQRYAILFGTQLWYGSLTNLLRSVQTGDSALEITFGMNLFEYLQQHPADGAIFNEAMTSISRQEAIAVRDAYDFSPFRTLVDVGGGHGILLTTILKANSALKGILFDRPAVVEGARALIQQEGIGDRCQPVDGDFFTAVPTGGDAYVLKYIIHDWDDERARKVLSNCREAMRPDSRVLVVDVVIPTGNTPFVGKLKDMVMLSVSPSGLERTEAEFKDLFSKAGFKLNRIIATNSIVSIIEGVPE